MILPKAIQVDKQPVHTCTVPVKQILHLHFCSSQLWLLYGNSHMEATIDWGNGAGEFVSIIMTGTVGLTGQILWAAVLK